MRWEHISSEIGANKTVWFGVSSCVSLGRGLTFALTFGPYRGSERLSWGSDIFGKIWGRSAVTFVLANFPYDGGRSEFGLAQPRAAGFFTVASGTFALGFFPL